MTYELDWVAVTIIFAVSFMGIEWLENLSNGWVQAALIMAAIVGWVIMMKLAPYYGLAVLAAFFFKSNLELYRSRQ